MTDSEFLNDRDCTPKGETPRTDAASRTVWDHALVPEWPSRGGSQDVVHVDFARELERELIEARADLEREIMRLAALRFAVVGATALDAVTEVHRLRAENDRLHKAQFELARALRVVEAAKELAANCEEYEFDDGLGYAAQGMWWYDLDNALEEWEAGR